MGKKGLVEEERRVKLDGRKVEIGILITIWQLKLIHRPRTLEERWGL
jgi:hypothetical protein